MDIKPPTVAGIFGHSWGVIAGISTFIVVRILMTPPPAPDAPRKQRIVQGLVATLSGYGIGLTFYPAVVDWRGLNPDIWNVPIGILLALLSVNIVRLGMDFDWAKVMDLVKVMRGGSYSVTLPPAPPRADEFPPDRDEFVPDEKPSEK